MSEGEAMPRSPQKSPLSDQLVAKVREDHRERMKKRRAKLTEVKQSSPDKEAFNVNEFGQIYNLRDSDGQMRITPERVEEFEMEYYLDNPDAKSMQEFADRRRELDKQSTG